MPSLLLPENPNHQSPALLVAKLLVVTLAYYVSGRMGLSIPYVGSHITLVWLPTGIAVAALLRWGFICWPGIFLGALATNFSVDSSPFLDSSIALGNTLGPLLAAWLLRRLKFHATLEHPYDILLLVVAAAIGMLASASGGVSSLLIFKVLSVKDAGPAWLSWWAGDCAGVLLAAPFLLIISRAALKKILAIRVEFLAWCLTFVVAGFGIFLLNSDADSDYLALAFTILPAVAWSAMRFGVMNSSIGVLVLALIAALASRIGLATVQTLHDQQNLLGLWLYIAVLILTWLIVLALQAVRQRAEETLQHSKADFRLLLSSVAEGIYGVDNHGACTFINPSALSLLGYQKESELLGKEMHDLIHHSHEGGMSCELAKCRLHRGLLSQENVHLDDELFWRKDGSSFPVDYWSRPVRQNGEVIGAVVTFQDITERKQADRALRIAAITFDTLEGILITDPDANILRVNQAFEDITGFSSDEVIGRNPRMFQSGRHDAEFYQDMWSKLRSNGIWSGEIWDKRKDGSIYPKLMTITAVYDDCQVVLNYVAVFSDISQCKQSEQEIHQLAFYDSLTMLPNRRLLQDRLQQAIAVSARNGRHGALLFLDLDHFKTINDTQGHAAGDLLLFEVARRLQNCVREGDTVSRLGGDEFMVVLEFLSNDEDEAAKQAELVAEKIRSEIGRPYRLKNVECQTTASIGVSLFSNYQESAEDLLMHADIAMYQAKAAGRNMIRFFDPHMQVALDMRTALEADLRCAIEKQQFSLNYQIQIDSSGRPTGAEALLRWHHPERALISPVQFIPLAEETGLILPIGRWVLETACAQLRAWQQTTLTRDLTLSVNVSAKQFRQADFVDQVESAVQRHGIIPRLLKLELTESILVENVEETIETMKALKEIGVQFAMDDFGTGYSSLQYLQQLPLDQLKIDRSFVRNMGVAEGANSIVQTIIAMAQSLGLDVIAEGVETEEQQNALHFYGCNHYQGYLFGKPVPIEQFEALMKQNDFNLEVQL